jgi:hypothetical protein
MNSTLLGLPRDIKELIYFDALSHAAEKVLVSCLLSLPPSLLFLIFSLSPYSLLKYFTS